MTTFNLKRYYFAFGSNMRIDQVRTRCPGSMYEGTAVLSGYRWQINKRGVANIVQLGDSAVEGLVFSITEKNEKALDRFEGIKSGHYQKVSVWLQFKPVPAVEVHHLAAELAASKQLSSRFRPQGIEVHIKALTYVSSIVEDGLIREEYVERMSRAIEDGLALGISQGYVSESLMRPVKGPTMESDTEPRPRRMQQRAVKSPAAGEVFAASVDCEKVPATSKQSRAEHKQRYNTELAYANAYDEMQDQQRQPRAPGSLLRTADQRASTANLSEWEDCEVSTAAVVGSHQETSLEQHASELLPDRKGYLGREGHMAERRRIPERTTQDGRKSELRDTELPSL